MKLLIPFNYKYFQSINFLYDFEHKIIMSNDFKQDSEIIKNDKLEDISSEFYEGIGIDLWKKNHWWYNKKILYLMIEQYYFLE